ncbi:7480_t:CDS:2 [Entrophospora sp. SA101]|nr:7480_t:CDS:2 [Entrophospora sp. SA101]
MDADTNEEIVRVTNNDDDNTASINDTDISEAFAKQRVSPVLEALEDPTKKSKDITEGCSLVVTLKIVLLIVQN